jgi:hypothetical protein
VILAIDALIATVSVLFSSVLYGVERVDEKPKFSLKDLVKSRLFILFSLPYFHAAITLPTTYYVLANYAQNRPLEAALYVSTINASVRLIMFLVLFAIVRKMIAIDIPWGKIAKYTFASIVTATILYVIPHPTRIALTLLMTGVGGATYLLLLVAIDKESRMLMESILQEIKSKVGKVF